MGNDILDVLCYRRRPTLPTQGSGSADVELIACILAGDPGAQEAFVARFGRLIIAVLRRLSFSPQEREDLYQQAFVHLWEQDYRRLRQWQGSKGKLSSFLGVVVARLAYDALALRCKRLSNTAAGALEEPAAQSDFVAMVFAKQRKAALMCALADLRPRDAALITCRYYDGLTYKELADAFGITVNHVGVALSRAEQRLHKKLCRDYPDLFVLQA